MIADRITEPVPPCAVLPMPVPSAMRPDPVRARVSAGPQRTHSQDLPAQLKEGSRGIHLLPETRGSRPRGPHPGDVLYWVACLGGACLLLFAATS